MQALYTIQEIAVLLIQISVFLIALLVVWVLVLAGAELYREGYIECMQVTPAGAVFFQSGNLLKLTDEEIEREVKDID